MELIDAQRDPQHVLLELSELVLLNLGLLKLPSMLQLGLTRINLLQGLTFALSPLPDQLVESLIHLV